MAAYLNFGSWQESASWCGARGSGIEHARMAGRIAWLIGLGLRMAVVSRHVVENRYLDAGAEGLVGFSVLS